MNKTWERQESGIARAIRKTGAAVAQPARGRWELVPSGGPTFSVIGILDGDWLLLESALARGVPIPPPADLLRLNAELSGLAKFARPARARKANVQAEVPIGDGIDFTARLRETLRGFAEAQAAAAGEPRAPGGEARAPGDARPAFIEALRKTDWPFRERDDGSVVVELESDRGYRQAKLATRSGGGFAAGVEIVDWSDATPSSREAAARLLLSANHGVRMARAVAAERDGRWTGRFEIRLESAPSTAELRHVLASLSVACRHWARELRSLHVDATARSYLAVCGVRS